MKKLVIASVLLAFSAPAFACPHMDNQTETKTAEKKKQDDTKSADAAKTAPKKAATPKAKTDQTPKTADNGKVSAR